MKKICPSAIEAEVVETVTLTQLSRSCAVPADRILDLVEHGILEPAEGAPLSGADWRFHAVSLTRATAALRLSRDLGVNLRGVALILDLLDDRDRLARRLHRYEAGMRR